MAIFFFIEIEQQNDNQILDSKFGIEKPKGTKLNLSNPSLISKWTR